MANIVDILLKVTDNASGGLEGFRDQLAKTGSAGKLLSDNLGKLSFAAVGAAAVNMGRNLLDNTKVLAEEAALIGNLASQAGFSVTAIQGFSHAAKQNSIDVGDATDFLRDFNFEVGEAFKEGGQSEKRFTDIGVSVRNSSGALRENADILADVADKLKNLSSDQERAAHVAKIFGEDNQKLLPILSSGSEGISNYTLQLQAMGGVMDEITVNKLGAFSDKFKELEAIQKEAQIASVDAALLLAEGYAIWQTGASSVAKFIAETSEIFIDPFGTIEDQELKIAAYKKQEKAIKSVATASEEQLKNELEAQKKAKLETEKHAVEVDKLRREYEKKISLQGLTDIDKALQSNQIEIDKIIDKYGIELPEAIGYWENQNKIAINNNSKLLADFNADLDRSIAESKASLSTTSASEASDLRKASAIAELDREVTSLTENAMKFGDINEETAQKIAEFQSSRTQEIEEQFQTLPEVVREVGDAVSYVGDAANGAAVATKTWAERVAEVGDAMETSTKRIGGLSDALMQMDAIGAQVFEWTGGGQRITGASAFGTVGLANDAESLIRVNERARAEALREQIYKAQTGQIEIGNEKLSQMIEQFNKISVELGGLGKINETRQTSNVNINFQPQTDYNNMSVESQRQIVNGISSVIGG